MGKQISPSASHPVSLGRISLGRVSLGTIIAIWAAGTLALGYALPGVAASPAAEVATPPGITLQLVGRGQGFGMMSFFGLVVLPREQIAFADARGMTLYTYAKDSPGRSRCTDACAKAWIPALAPRDARPVGDWSIFNRGHGQQQWQYQGKPVYTFVQDTDIGSLFGVSAKNLQQRTSLRLDAQSKPPPAGWDPALAFPVSGATLPDDISIREVEDAGGLAFVNGSGLTLYAYKGAKGGEESVDAATWKPLRAPELAHSIGQWSIVDRNDGVRQWTYRGMPVFTFSGDFATGDANGVGWSKDWEPALAVAFYMPTGVRITQTLGRGKVLATPEGMTLYRRDGIPMAFGGGQSTRHGVPIQPGVGREIGVSLQGCEGACLKSWRPFVAPADARPDGFWDIAIRPDGVHQWVYQGYALYTYAGDHRPGDMNGNDIYNVVLSGNPKQLNTVSTAMFGTAGLYWTIAYP